MDTVSRPRKVILVSSPMKPIVTTISRQKKKDVMAPRIKWNETLETIIRPDPAVGWQTDSGSNNTLKEKHHSTKHERLRSIVYTIQCFSTCKTYKKLNHTHDYKARNCHQSEVRKFRRGQVVEGHDRSFWEQRTKRRGAAGRVWRRLPFWREWHEHLIVRDGVEKETRRFQHEVAGSSGSVEQASSRVLHFWSSKEFIQKILCTF